MPVLRTLGPSYDVNSHGRHAAVLVKALLDTGPTAASNIALAGHYGSGKSSVIQGVERQLAENKLRYINLSMSSLGLNDTAKSRVHGEGAAVPPLTNLIQKEIVKQLLYRKPPSAMRGSRYFRIDTFRRLPAIAWSLVVGITLALIATLLGLQRRIEEVGPQGLLAEHDNASWLLIGVLGIFVALVWFLALRTFQSRLRVESVSAGGAAISLQAKEHSYFDDYLDEIVYFFQKTGTSVAIFEDLDRFRDPHIFETLRELNTVLNNCEQIKTRPVRFVYAVRDSIFEHLDLTSTAPEGETQEQAPTTEHAATRETRPSTNRTKFFDLVIPMVPFLTHRSARDLIAQEFRDATHQPSSDLVNLIGLHLTDMRLIRNIRNEFEIYQASILGEGGLEGLTADRLFAMLVYKNLHLDDSEQIRLGTSSLDRAYASYRRFIQHQMTHQAAVSQAALDKIGRGAAWESRATAAGERLRTVLPAFKSATGRSGPYVLEIAGTNYEEDEFGSVDLWRVLATRPARIRIMVSGYAALSVSGEDLERLIGPVALLEPLVSGDEQRLRRESERALAIRTFVAAASMADALKRQDLTMPHKEGLQPLAEVVAEDVSRLALDLLTAGHVDENFTLYCSDYHDVAISVAAMNFILHCVQPARYDYRFHLDAGSVSSVEAEMGTRFLDTDSVFNIDVFDHYLQASPDKIASALRRLATPGDPRSDFVDVYLKDGAKPELLAEALMPSWAQAFVRLANSEVLDTDTQAALLSVALEQASIEVDYETDDVLVRLISERYESMPILVQPSAHDRVDEVAQVLQGLGVVVPHLRPLWPDQRRAIADRGLFPVTADNIMSAVEVDAVPPLDTIRDARPLVYRHVLRHADLYLGALAPDAPSVSNPLDFVPILNELAAAQVSSVVTLAQHAAPECVVDDIAEVGEDARPGVVSAGRFTPTVANLCELTRGGSLNDDLVAMLHVRDLVSVESVPEEERTELATLIVNSRDLTPAERVRHLRTLVPDGTIDLDEIDEQGLDAIPALVEAGLLDDGVETYERLSERPYVDREALLAVSRNLPAYISLLPLSADDLGRLIHSARIALDVKQTLVSDGDYLASHLDKGNAARVAQWAYDTGTINVPGLVALARKGAPAAAVLELLSAHLEQIAQDDLNAILIALGDAYAELTHTGHQRPKLPLLSGTEELLDELRKRNLVSSYTKDTPLLGQAKWKVAMRR
jgi:hypothetical protein